MSVRYHLELTGGDDPEIVAARLWTAGALGVQELPDALVAWFETRQQDVPPGGTWSQQPDEDWLATWREGLEPVRVGRVLVVPTWLAATTPQLEGEVHIELDPGMAFGSGHHATTRLCLGALQDELAPQHRVLDVGCGTGILAIAAALLGAAAIEAVDVDPDAVVATRRNARANGVELDVHLGSAPDAQGSADLVLANLLTPTLHTLAPALVDCLAPDGLLVASGVASERAAGVATALTAAGAAAVGRRDEDGWSVLLHRAPSSHDRDPDPTPRSTS
jgi:ribosomal protein L11 methyltransferase